MTDDTNLFGDTLPRLGHPLFTERWSNRKAFWIGVYVGQGLTSTEICERLADGVQPNTVRGMVSQWGHRLPDEVPSSHGPVRVMLPAKHRTKIGAEARRRQITMPELCGRVLETMARDDLWKAILDA